ncbi:MAG: Outer membrane protein transport protein (OMPP1/FadL/TodX) [Elusimicrobia bacterium ADurb.Bin231]|nr:MAG: Outer membrane protein transport protein (OMPP1/FadL/TodX) [Elusimicrobia bacterium ADurb.Bin231]
MKTITIKPTLIFKLLHSAFYLLPVTCCLLLCQFALVPSIFGYTLGGLTNYGDVVSGHNARSIGMSSAEIAVSGGDAAVFANPAAIYNIGNSRIVASISPVFNILSEEKRYLDPLNLYDGNQNLIIQRIDNSSSKFKIGSFGAAASVWEDKLFAGISFCPVTDMSYEHSEKVTDGLTDKIKKDYDASGGIYSLNLGLNYRIIEEASFGMTVGFLSGSSSLAYDETGYTNNLMNYIDNTDSTRDYSGTFIKYGVLFSKWGYRAGMFYQSSADITEKTSVTGKDYNLTSANAWSSSKTDYETEFTYPEKYGIGIAYQFSGKTRPLFALDWTQQTWNSFTSAVTSVSGSSTGNPKTHNTDYKQTREFKVGFEHWLTDWIPMRYGFRYQQFYLTGYETVYNFYHQTYVTKENRPVFYSFSLGVGYMLENIDIDFGCEFGKRDYNLSPSERYDELLQRFMVTARWKYGK